MINWRAALSPLWRTISGVSNPEPTTGNAVGYLAAALWLAMESQYNQLSTVSTQLGDIMAQVQVDDGVLTSAASTLQALAADSETLSSAITTFLQSPAAQAIPEGDLTVLNDALNAGTTADSDVEAATTALNNATTQTPTPDPSA